MIRSRFLLHALEMVGVAAVDADEGVLLARYFFLAGTKPERGQVPDVVDFWVVGLRLSDFLPAGRLDAAVLSLWIFLGSAGAQDYHVAFDHFPIFFLLFLLGFCIADVHQNLHVLFFSCVLVLALELLVEVSLEDLAHQLGHAVLDFLALLVELLRDFLKRHVFVDPADVEDVDGIIEACVNVIHRCGKKALAELLVVLFVQSAVDEVLEDTLVQFLGLLDMLVALHWKGLGRERRKCISGRDFGGQYEEADGNGDQCARRCIICLIRSRCESIQKWTQNNEDESSNVLISAKRVDRDWCSLGIELSRKTMMKTSYPWHLKSSMSGFPPFPLPSQPTFLPILSYPSLFAHFPLIPVNPFTKIKDQQARQRSVHFLFCPLRISCNLLSSSSKDLATKWVPVGWQELRSLVGFHCLITQSVVAQQAVALWLKTLLSTKRSPNLIPLASPPKFSTCTLFFWKKSSSWLDSLSTIGRISYLVTLGLQDLQETGLEQQQLSNLPNMIRNLLYKFY